MAGIAGRYIIFNRIIIVICGQMKHLIVFIFFLPGIAALSQQITCRITDANTGTTLPYATVIFEKANQFLYTDSSGEFSFNRNALADNDSVTVEYLSYSPVTLPQHMLTDGFIIKMEPQTNQLQNITVIACTK